MKLVIFGAGYSARAFARTIGDQACSIVGTTRSLENFAVLAEAGITPVAFDGMSVRGDLDTAIGDATHVLISSAPDNDGDPVLRAAGERLQMADNLAWIGYYSTVGVYGDHNGAVVKEDSACQPVSMRSKRRMVAEAKWRQFTDQRQVPLTILRLGGIYGPGRNVFVNIENGTARRLVKPGQVFNRIHVDDIATATRIAALMRVDGIINITDDEPAPPQDVVDFAHRLAGREPPPSIDFDNADLSPMARSFYSENKRVSNKKSKSLLGMQYAHPNYRAALTRMWCDDLWR